MLKKLLSFAIGILAMLSTAHAETTCGQSQAGSQAYRWCIYEDGSTPNPTILYYLHGGGDSERSWGNDQIFADMRAAMLKNGQVVPTVITVSFGPQWLLSEIPRADGTSLLGTLAGEIMPSLEVKLTQKPAQRFLMGASMGGFNAAVLSLKNPKLFQRVALLCPGISTVGPYTPESDVRTFLDRHQPFINENYVRNLISWALAEFPTQQDWMNHNPLHLANTIVKSSPAYYVSCGTQDEYGFFEGAEQFAQLAQARGASVKWVPLDGAHCAIDANSVAEFIGKQQ